MDPLGSDVSVSDYEQTNRLTDEGTLVQPLPHRSHSDSSAVSVVVEVPSLKRKRSSRLSSLKPESDRPSQPPMTERVNERSPLPSQSPKRWRMDCVLITTLPPVPRKKTALPKQPEDEGDRSRTKTQSKMRGRQKRQGKQQEVTPHTSVPSRSHSVSSLRPPLFDPVSIDPI